MQHSMTLQQTLTHILSPAFRANRGLSKTQQEHAQTQHVDNKDLNNFLCFLTAVFTLIQNKERELYSKELEKLKALMHPISSTKTSTSDQDKTLEHQKNDLYEAEISTIFTLTAPAVLKALLENLWNNPLSPLTAGDRCVAMLQATTNSQTLLRYLEHLSTQQTLEFATIARYVSLAIDMRHRLNQENKSQTPRALTPLLEALSLFILSRAKKFLHDPKQSPKLQKAITKTTLDTHILDIYDKNYTGAFDKTVERVCEQVKSKLGSDFYAEAQKTTVKTPSGRKTLSVIAVFSDSQQKPIRRYFIQNGQLYRVKRKTLTSQKPLALTDVEHADPTDIMDSLVDVYPRPPIDSKRLQSDSTSQPTSHRMPVFTHDSTDSFEECEIVTRNQSLTKFQRCVKRAILVNYLSESTAQPVMDALSRECEDERTFEPNGHTPSSKR